MNYPRLKLDSYVLWSGRSVNLSKKAENINAFLLWSFQHFDLLNERAEYPVSIGFIGFGDLAIYYKILERMRNDTPLAIRCFDQHLFVIRKVEILNPQLPLYDISISTKTQINNQSIKHQTLNRNLCSKQTIWIRLDRLEHEAQHNSCIL